MEIVIVVILVIGVILGCLMLYGLIYKMPKDIKEWLEGE